MSAHILKYLGICQCIPKYPSTWVYGNVFPYTQLYENISPGLGAAFGTGRCPQVRIWQLRGAPLPWAGAWNVFPYTQVLGYLGVYTNIPKNLGIWECIPMRMCMGVWECIPMYRSSWAKSHVFQYTQVLGHMGMYYHISNTQVLGHMELYSHIPKYLGI
jgi:hypothetical protein